MIYTLDGTPIADALKAAAERVALQRYQHRPTNYVMARDADGRTGRAFKIERDRNGDIMRIFRSVHTHGAGAGYLARRAKRAVYMSPEAALFVKITPMMASGLSQRKTAAALGIHLSKLQRTLAKGQPAVA